MIKTEQLRYLIELDRTNSFHKCAENLYLSQPAISLSIRNLEKELGVTLFERTPAGVFPTEIGKKVILQAKSILQELNDIYLICDDFQVDSGTVTLENLNIHTMSSFSVNILPTVLPSLQKRFPDTRFTFQDDNFETMLEAVSCRPYNIGFYYIQNDEWDTLLQQFPTLRIDLLHDIQFNLIVSKTSDFLPKEPIQLGKPFHHSPVPLVKYKSSLTVINALIQQMIDENIVEIVFESPNLPLSYAYIYQGLGALLGPALNYDKPITTIDRSRVKFHPIEVEHKVSLVLFYNQDLPENVHQILLHHMFSILNLM